MVEQKRSGNGSATNGATPARNGHEAKPAGVTRRRARARTTANEDHCTNGVFAERVEKFNAALVMLQGNVKVVRHKLSQEWGLSKRQMDRYVAAAREERIERMGRALPEMLGTALEDRRFVIERALAAGELDTALRAMKERDTLAGLYVERIKFDGKVAVGTIAEMILSARDGFASPPAPGEGAAP